MSNTSINPNRGQNDGPSNRSTQYGPRATQAPDAAQSERRQYTDEEIQLLRELGAPGYCQYDPTTDNDPDTQQPGAIQAPGAGPSSQCNNTAATQGPGTSPIRNYIRLSAVPAPILREAQSRTIEGRPLIDVFNKILHCFYYHIGDNTRYDLNDIGAGNLFADAYKDQLRYVPERKCWYRYDGQKWIPDNGAAMEKCKSLAQILKALWKAVYSKYKDNKFNPEVLDRFFSKWQTRRGRETILKDAETVYPIKMSEFDTDPYLLNGINGTLDMRSRMLYPHRPDDLITKMANVSFDSNAWCDRWVKHIEEIMMGDPDRILFLQQALGYALTGATNYECFFILYGPTSRNGKGVTMETFATLMGDYARSARPDTIAQKQKANGSGPSEDLARLAGARFINISEPDKNMILSSALVKTLTGNDTISARYLHENSFEFRLQGKLFVNTNYLPAVTDPTIFTSNRVKVIPFERHFEPYEQDKNLKAYLAEPQNLSGILNWCLIGLRSLGQSGFVDSPAIQLATNSYQTDSDKVGCFLADMLEECPGSELFTETVYTNYKQWCDDNGRRPSSLANFKKDLASRAQIVRKRPAARPQDNPRSIIIGFKLKQANQPITQLPPYYHVVTDESEV